jgi:hypothetical protein
VYRIYADLGILLLMSLLVAGLVSVTKYKRGAALSIAEVAASVASLSLLVLGVFLCGWSAFAFAGGPDGRFLHSDSLYHGFFLLAAALAIVLLALRLLSAPAKWAAIFVAPAVLTVVGQALKVWPLTLSAFTLGPVLCLVTIVVLWVRREMKALPS